MVPPTTATEIQLATLVDHVPPGDGWLHEQKFDGYRIIAVLVRGTVTLWSRNGIEWTERLPEIASAVRTLPASRLVLDGEVAVLQPDGRTSFQAMQRAFEGDVAPSYFVFDLLEQDGDDLRDLPLEERKARLQDLLATAPAELRYSGHIIGRGEEFFALACKRELEGIVSKRRDAPYRAGRGKDWVKTKCLRRQELVIGGYTEPSGSRTGLGALVVGYYDEGRLRYAGKVGTGFDARALGDLRRRCELLATDACPFTPAPKRAWTGPGVHWCLPKLVCEVAFAEWTEDSRLRHPSFQGLRLDKPAIDVVRETPVRADAHRALEPARAARKSRRRA